MPSVIKTVIVIGASGSVGPQIVSALLTSNFAVSVLTRESSSSEFPAEVTAHRTDYSQQSLVSVFKNFDAIISTIATFSTHLQKAIIDAAITAGVKRFIPSEYGIDTSPSTIAEVIPPALLKQETVKYLKGQEEKISWTAVCVGSFFDWIFQYPGLMGWDLPGRKATVFDGGNVEYEATNVAQIGRAVAAVLATEHIEETKNQYVYVNSFTTTQNQVLRALEKHTSEKFEVVHASAKALGETGRKMLKGGGEWGAAEVITAAIYGDGGFNNFSRTKELWNERLGLKGEDLDDSVARIVANVKIGAE
ncbi:hypothetical protein BGZ60DRAFT_362655 [Tricladium varicosporioides]|nr:hypothetical protein BGZ60DRAFT_362655 [Hymenoscyphus varicosporioides]